MGQVRAVFHNSPGRIGARATLKWWQQLASSHDVMASAEARHLGTRRVGLKGTVLDHLRGWDAFQPQQAGDLPATPLMWRTSKLQLVEAHPLRHYPATRVGPWGAGPAWMAEGWTNAVCLREGSRGQLWWFLVGHWVPSVQQTRATVEKQGPEALASWTKRRELHQLETEGAANLMNRLQRANPRSVVALCGDTNAEPRWHGMDALRDVASPVYPGPTHGKRAIDGFWLHERSQVKLLRAAVIPGPLADDHDAVSVTLEANPTP